MNKKQKSPSCLCCKGTCDCEYACSHPHTEESCCTYPLEHKGCEQIKEAYYKGRNQTIAEVEKIIVHAWEILDNNLVHMITKENKERLTRDILQRKDELGLIYSSIFRISYNDAVKRIEEIKKLKENTNQQGLNNNAHLCCGGSSLTKVIGLGDAVNHVRQNEDSSNHIKSPESTSDVPDNLVVVNKSVSKDTGGSPFPQSNIKGCECRRNYGDRCREGHLCYKCEKEQNLNDKR